MDIVRAIHLDHRVQFGLSAKRESRRGGGTHADIRLFEWASANIFAARRDTAGQLHEIHEVPADIRQRFDLSGVDQAANLGLRRFDQRFLFDDQQFLFDGSHLHSNIDDGGAGDRRDDTIAHGRLKA